MLEKLLRIGIIIVVIASVTGCDWSSTQKQEVQPENIYISTFNGIFAAPIFIASEQGYFEKEGLDIHLDIKSSGKAALEDVLSGKSAFATVAETPFMHAGLKGEKIYLIASFVESEKNLAIIIKDKNLKLENLKGKKIGVTLGTNGGFFLDTILLHHGILCSEIEKINTKPDGMIASLMSGKVDAVSTWNPHVYKLKNLVNDIGSVNYGDGNYTGSFNLIAKQDFVKKNRKLTTKVVRAIAEAERFIKTNPQEFLKIMSRVTTADLDFLSNIANDYNFNVSLHQSLLITLEDQVRWAIEHKLTDISEVPNYLDYIYFDAMNEINPDAVTMIH